MFVTLVAVIVALVLGHVAHAPVAALRQFQWFSHGLQWLGARAPEGAFWRQRHGIWLALLPPVLVLALLQFALWGRLLGLASLVLGVLVLAWTWGPARWSRDGAERRGQYVRLWRKETGGWALMFAQLIPAPPVSAAPVVAPPPAGG